MLKDLTLLFVEDDQDTMEYIHELLAPHCKKIFIGYDGVMGFDAYDRYKPDIVLSDINMPNMNGIELIKKLRELDSHIPVIFFTSVSDTSLFAEAVNLGVDGFVVKPVTDINCLLNPLEKVAKMLRTQKETQKLKNILELQSRILSFGEIISNIAHQWRQPLNNICLGVQDIYSVLDENGVGELINKESRDIIMEQIGSLSGMIDDLRDFFHQGSGTLDEITLNDVLGKVYNLYSSSFIFNKIRYVTDFDSDIKVKADPNNLIQAFINIINNSKSAMISNTREEERYLFITASTENGEAVIKFCDSGGGIEQSVINRIFEPFFTSKHQTVGAGIGLYMTFQIIVNHCTGTIEAENTEYEYEGKKLKGALITVRLPLSI